MKQLFVTILLIGFMSPPSFSQKKADVLARIGDMVILSDDFKNVYTRNNNNIIDPAEKKTPEEYLELYINFKLKVLEAQRLGLDTMQSFTEELAGYRSELAAPYLTDISFTENLVEETYNRMKKEVNASHILITFPENAGADDTLIAWNRIMDISNELKAGMNFEEAAAKYSQDPSAVQNSGDLGWFTVFQMVTPFEDAAYSTPVGQVSGPVKSRFGYHLIKVNGQREATGEIKVAHIMKMFPQHISEERKASLKQEMDSLYTLLKNGANFAELAKKHSDDQRSAANGGEMPYFGRSRMIPEFSTPAFLLKKDGDFTQPVETAFGYHIIKRLDLKPIPAFEEIKSELEERIKRDPERSTQSRDLFISKLKSQYSFSRNQQAVDKLLSKTEDWFVDNKIVVPEKTQQPEVLFTLDGKDFTTNDWIDYLKPLQIAASGEQSNVLHSQYEMWEQTALIDYEDQKLESKYPAFKSLLQEYYDGLLLFAVSEQKIWSKASADTTGLQAFYLTNRDKYMWDERYRGVIVKCSNPEIRNKVEDRLGEGVPVSEIYDLTGFSPNMVSIEEGVWSKGENPIIDFYVWDGPKPANWVAETGFVQGETVMPEPKTLEEARGFHISDYQQFLEDEWIRELRSKYRIKINKKALKNI